MGFDQEYFEFVRRYATVDGLLMPPVISVLGLCGEAEELRASCSDLLRDLGNEEDTALEISDCLFYVVALGLAYGLQPVFSPHDHFLAGLKTTASLLQSKACVVAEKMKHASWHAKPYTDLQADLNSLVYMLAGAAANLQLTVDDVAERNKTKLRARWPLGFSPCR